jgi:hypothetical protein
VAPALAERNVLSPPTPHVSATAPANLRLATPAADLNGPTVPIAVCRVDVEPAASVVRVESARTVAEAHADEPKLHVVNGWHFILRYTLNRPALLNATGIALWYREGTGEWSKAGQHAVSEPAVSLRVAHDGRYDVLLIPEGGRGSRVPQASDRPLARVEVDTTAPTVAVLDTAEDTDSRGRTLLIRWQTRDQNLGERPVRLSFAPNLDGPWKPIATDLTPTGSCVWRPPDMGMDGVFVRVQAVDLAGNASEARTPQRVLGSLTTVSAKLSACEPITDDTELLPALSASKLRP